MLQLILISPPDIWHQFPFKILSQFVIATICSVYRQAIAFQSEIKNCIPKLPLFHARNLKIHKIFHVLAKLSQLLKVQNFCAIAMLFSFEATFDGFIFDIEILLILHHLVH